MENIHSSLFAWKKIMGRHYGSSSLSKLGLSVFPKSLQIKSEWTGEVLDFTIDEQTMLENEFFDGEATAYRAGDVSIVIWTC